MMDRVSLMKKVPSPPPEDAFIAPSKLFIRSEVLAVIAQLSTNVQAVAQQDKINALKRLSRIDDRKAVLSILTRELKRHNTPETIRVIAELLIELGHLKQLQDPLWSLIEDPKTTDEAKDAANLVLRHLGDDTDPELYLEYLQDPQGLINRETERMLEASLENPEALIDFMDFLLSVPATEQIMLLNSLQADYPSNHLMMLYQAFLDADPPVKVQEQVIKNLGKIVTPSSALYLQQLENRLQGYLTQATLARDTDTALLACVQKAMKPLRLAGLYKPPLPSQGADNHASVTILASMGDSERDKPRMLANGVLSHNPCYATLPDGLGNQGLLLSCKRPNGDIAVLSVALNDEHGLLGAFGFYSLSNDDYNRLCDKFHEEASKIEVPLTYCLNKLHEAEQTTLTQRHSVPYEYTAWHPLLTQMRLVQGQPPLQAPTEASHPLPFLEQLALCQQWADPKRALDTAYVYQHPDLQTWYLDLEDENDYATVYKQVDECLKSLLQHLESSAQPHCPLTTDAISQLEVLSITLAQRLSKPYGPWMALWLPRLAETACLLNTATTQTFCALVATEVVTLSKHQQQALPSANDPDGPILVTPFLQQFARRSLEEALFSLGQDLPASQQAMLAPFVDEIQASWALDTPE
jgi:hypothetical protein